MSQKRQERKQETVRFTESEKEKVQKKADASGIPFATYVRQAALLYKGGS